MQLRDYQERSITELYRWLEKNSGHPCVVLPTGAGKSVIIAELVRQALQGWPETKVLMLCHQKELLEQNAQKMRAIWPGAPMGVYSASLGKKQLGEPILFAGIQSIRNKAHLVGHIDICIVDECHCISHKEEGGYRKFISDLLAINPNMRVVGYSATPYRLGHGYITDKPALFDDLIEPVSIEELLYKGFLSPLRSKVTALTYDTSGVKKRGGEFVEADLQAAVNTFDNNSAIVDEVIARAGDRRSWLFFCVGIEHAEAVCDMLKDRGISAGCVTGKTPQGERARLLEGFKRGEIRALTSVGVLTTGFDAPNTDLIAMLRPTMSPALYVQMAGRGLRVKEHTDHCLVLDFAGLVKTHGPITNVNPPEKSGKGEAPVKACPECAELVHLSVMTCPGCGYQFPPPEEKESKPKMLHMDDIMGKAADEMEVASWAWRMHVSKQSGKEMLAVTYYGSCLSSKPITEYITVLHEGYAGEKARAMLAQIARKAGAESALELSDLDLIAATLQRATPPSIIGYKADGKFHRVLMREWNHAATPRA